jgi:hypothetical protein
MSANLAEYFAANRPQPHWQGGERIEGLYNGVPFVGTVAYENMRNEDEGLMAAIHLDLPLKDGDTWTTIIRVKPQSIQLRDTGLLSSLANADNTSKKPGRKNKS